VVAVISGFVLDDGAAARYGVGSTGRHGVLRERPSCGREPANNC
jgi:hypothetical protein